MSAASCGSQACRNACRRQAWQIEEIEKALREADASDFATEEELQTLFLPRASTHGLMRIKWLRRAARSLAAEADFIAKDNPIAADRMVVRVRAAVDHLLDHPAMGRAGRVPNTREFVVSGTPYIVAYRARGDMVEVLHVLPAARRRPERF